MHSRFLVAAATATMVVLAFAPGARADDPPADCSGADQLRESGLIDDALAEYAQAASAGRRCGTGEGFELAKRARSDAEVLAAQGTAALEAGELATATARYRLALESNRQQAEALAGLQAIGGFTVEPGTPADPFGAAIALLRLGRPEAAREVAIAAIKEGKGLGLVDEDCSNAPDEPVSAQDWRCELRDQLDTDPFLPALLLLRLGQDEAATAAALKAIEAGHELGVTAARCTGTPDDATTDAHWRCKLLDEVTDDDEPGAGASVGERLRDVGDWFSSWWKLLAGLVVAVLWLAFMAVRHQWRFAPRFVRTPRRLLLDAKDQTGLDCKLLDSLTTRVREDLARDSVQHGSTARYVVASDLDVTLPDLADVGPQAKFLAALWPWFRKQWAVTLRISLLPPKERSISCHVVLTDAAGTVLQSKAFGRAERVLTSYAPQAWDDKEKAPKAPGDTQVAQLAALVSAWTSFQYGMRIEKLRRREIGTSDPTAHSLFLEGVARIEHHSRNASSYFRQAIAADPAYLDAMLNLGHALELAGDHVEADVELAKLQRTLRGEGPPSEEEALDRQLGIAVRTALRQGVAPGAASATTGQPTTVADLLRRWVPPATPGQGRDPLAATRAALARPWDGRRDWRLGRELRRSLFDSGGDSTSQLGRALRRALGEGTDLTRFGVQLDRALRHPGVSITDRALGESFREALRTPIADGAPATGDDAVAIGRSVRLAIGISPGLASLVRTSSIGAKVDRVTEYHLDLLIRATYSRTFAQLNRVASDLVATISTPARTELPELAANVEELARLFDLVSDASAHTERDTQMLVVALEQHVHDLALGVGDLTAKRKCLEADASVVLPTLVAPQSGAAAPELLKLLAEAETHQLPARIHYTVATIWARDARLRSHNATSDPEKAQAKRWARAARKKAAKQLETALALDPGYAGWKDDPDFSPIAESLDALFEEDEPSPPKPQLVKVDGDVGVNLTHTFADAT